MLADDDFLAIFRSHVAEFGDQPALVQLDFPGTDANGLAMTYRELDTAARRVAAWLVANSVPGERAVLLFPSGCQFVVGFLGCLYARTVAVPAPMLDTGGRGTIRLAGILADADAHVVLTDAEHHDAVSAWLTGEDTASAVACGATDLLAAGTAEIDLPVLGEQDDIAFLQYTSGSTSEPKGVMVTHANIAHNQAEIHRALGTDRSSHSLGWLPHYHDMGLIGQFLGPLYLGSTCYFMSPMTFLKRPHLWLKAISDLRIPFSVAPNFAFELVTRRVTDEQLAGLDLSCLRSVLNGSEPVHADTLDAFVTRFASAGLAPHTPFPCYGMAEVTLFATGSRGGTVVSRRVDVAALERNELRPATEDATGTTLVSSGTAGEIDVRIVDPDTGMALPDERIGEIWLRGRSVAAGYWRQPELTSRTFRASTADGEAGFLRTGDLGVLSDGELYVTGRLKDVLVVNGRNLYPHDIERAVRREHPALAAGAGAVFALGERDDRLVLVHEVKKSLADRTEDELVGLLRAAVRAEFDVHLTQVVFVPPGGIAKTTSGKVRRAAVRQAFLADRLTRVPLTPAGAVR
ncbi:MAG TPA: fatty acyl-AMP ligase [Pseudonocardiaceae bacterium]